MNATRNTIPLPSRSAAERYLDAHKFQLVGRHWLRGRREVAVLTDLPSGKCSVRIEVSV